MPQLQVIAVDLDGTVWCPDMYELWGGGGSPFSFINNSTLKDRVGNSVKLLGIAGEILDSLKDHPTIIPAYVSTCDEPDWAFECLSKFKTVNGHLLQDCVPKSLQLIYKANKQDHFRRIKKQFPDVGYEEMLFFDNQTNNIHDVSKLGVACCYCPEGLSEKSWKKGLAMFGLSRI